MRCVAEKGGNAVGGVEVAGDHDGAARQQRVAREFVALVGGSRPIDEHRVDSTFGDGGRGRLTTFDAECVPTEFLS